MDKSLDCSTVLDLSKKSVQISEIKINSRNNSPNSSFEEKFSDDSTKTRTVLDHENRQYESSALINTPPHETEITASQKNVQNIFNVQHEFNPNLKFNMLNYPVIIPDPHKSSGVHLDITRSQLVCPASYYPQFATHPPMVNSLQNPANVNPFAFSTQTTIASLPTKATITNVIANNQPNAIAQTNSLHQIVQTSKGQIKKSTRPFKVYPNVPTFGNDDIDHIMNELSDERYEEYRDRVLKNVERTNNKGTNIKMRRDNKNCAPSSTIQDKDEAYLEKRKKNNAAAKRSRDARKRKEDEIAIRAAFLENKFTWMVQTIKKLETENKRLRQYEEIVRRLNTNSANFS